MKSHLNFLFKNSILLKIILFSIFAKIVLAFIIPVVGDESYYWFWGKNLQLSYFDHPAGVAWLTWISDLIYQILPTPLMGISIRLPFILLSSLAFVVWLKNYELYQKDTKHIHYFALLYLLNPLLGLGGIFATPDVPLLFFWALSFYAVLKIKQTQKSKWYAFLGASLGLGFCSKYHIVLFPLTILISLFLIKDLRIIRLKKLGLTFIFGLLFSLPVLIWNSQNDWVSFAFQLNHGFNDRRDFNISWPVTYILAQILLFNPIVLFYIFKNVKLSLPKNMALTQWGFFLLSSLRALVEANWPITAQAQGLTAIDKNFKSYFKASIIYAVILWCGLIIVFFTPFGTHKFNRLPQSFAATEIYNLTKDFRPLYGPTYQMSSLLHLVSQEDIYKLNGISRIDFYDSIKGSYPDEKTFYVLKYTYTDWPQWTRDYKIENVMDISKYDLELYRVSHE